MKKYLFYLIIVLILSSFLCFIWKTVPYDEQLINIQLKKVLGNKANDFENEQVNIKALLLDYSDSEELVLKTRISLLKYPDKTKEILSVYGAEKEFREILSNYGEVIIPIIHYFTKNEILSLKAMNAASNALKTAKEKGNKLLNWLTGKEESNIEPKQQEKTVELDATKRGWYAVNFIKNEGYHFIGQFVIDKNKDIKWIQTERIMEGLTSLFIGGVRNLETKYALDEKITKEDVFDVGLDIVSVIGTAGTLKILSAGKKIIKSEKALSLTSRTAILGSKVLSKGRVLKIAKYSAILATGYILVEHPSLLNSALSEFANFLGINPLLFQFIAWSVIISLLLYPFSWLFKLFLTPVSLLLNFIVPKIDNYLNTYRPKMMVVTSNN